MKSFDSRAAKMALGALNEKRGRIEVKEDRAIGILKDVKVVTSAPSSKIERKVYNEVF
jgi:hypothetical protein